MKKVLMSILVVTLLLACTGCVSNQVTVPEGYPDYTFTETPDTEALRQTALRAMHDLLSIEWSPSQTISYYNTTGRDKQFDYKPGTIYGGLLYTGASSGLFHFLEFYDMQTGILTYPGTGDDLRRNIGSGCADSLMWSWATVSNSFSCGYYPSMMVYKNGFLPVGDYTYDFNLESYYHLPTKAIIENNGENVILDAYTRVLPADALVSSSVDHAMMVIEEPTVVRNADGSIDKENSYIMIQDQRGGDDGTGFIKEQVNGHTVHFNSARSLKMTFAFLIKKNYIPVTLAELIGTKAYDKAQVTLSQSCNVFADTKNTVIEANYPLVVINLLVTDHEGTTAVYDKVLIHSASISGPARSYDLGQWDALQDLDTSSYKKVAVEVVVSTGERFIPIDMKT